MCLILEELFNISRCYCKAISLVEDDNLLIWHDLGTCYLHHALNTEEPKKVEQLLHYAMAATRHCTINNPSSCQHWNLLGNVAMARSK
ncbi:hypothetical protein NQ314_018888 [Rhamnusium bicolor]|uniref:Uncharacterized protein n=1 Tax=Rhamnusium bicolor TaxID=1586634 RepID=A0AAV8WQY7_9CUCU|nr:hypothetical protein NQ314_018888 [Rhamnusium bicolor]